VPRSKDKHPAACAASSELEPKRPRKRRDRTTLPMSLIARSFKDTYTEEDVILVWESIPFPRHCFPDDELDCWRRRLTALRDLLVDRGGFPKKAADRALVDPDAKSKERVVRWLRGELEKLRTAERRVGEAPVLRGAGLSRLTIADFAMTMVQFLEEAPGENLICLLQELLDVDRHRKALAELPGDLFIRAAMAEARARLQGKTYGVRELANLISVDPSTITRWRRSTEYEQEIQGWQKHYETSLDHLVDEALLENPNLTQAQAFTHALRIYRQRGDFQKYRAELVKRLAHAKTVADVRQVWERHLEGADIRPRDEYKLYGVFLARLAELEKELEKLGLTTSSTNWFWLRLAELEERLGAPP
jgi:hypothetical protein